MKYKYMTKEGKKEVRDKFARTKRGAHLIPILNRLVVESILCLIIGVGIIVYGFINEIEWWYYTLSGLLFVCSIIFFVSEYNIRRKEYAIICRVMTEAKKRKK